MSGEAAAIRPDGDDGIPSPPITDWLLRFFVAFRFRTAWVSAAIAIVYVAISQLCRHWFEGSGFSPEFFLLDSLNALIVAVTPLCILYLRRGILHDLRELRPVLGCTPNELEDIGREITCVPAGRLLPSVALAIVFFALMPIFDPKFFPGAQPDLGDPLMTFYIIRNAFTGWIVGVAVASEIQATRVYAKLGWQHVEIDLLDTRPLHTFTRRGLRSVFVWIGAASLVSLFWLSDTAGAANGGIMVAIIVMANYFFFYSIRGVHHSIVEEKTSQLEALRCEIRREREGLLDASNASSSSPRLANLLTYHDLVERAPEWPFDTPVVVRLGLFVLLGLGSWLGGALVERMLENFF